MLRKFLFLKISLGFIFLSAINLVYVSNAIASESLKVELQKELKKGNFFIGLKQYIGGKNDSFSKNDNIVFKSENDFLILHSLNGIKHKSKKINISWKDIPVKNPYTIKRIVFGPFASYESAQKKAIDLKEKGFEATIAYPKNWEVWVPLEKNLPKQKFKYKIYNKIYNTQITPFLKTENNLQKLEGPIYISSDKEIKINNTNYGKKLYLLKDSYGTWTLIQKIKFDDYLLGVLPYEIGPNSPLEALKAQAVIARTWGIYNAERFRMDQYHLCITTQCQVYKPTNVKYKKVQKAIRETSNVMLTYSNKPINSFYHGSNGGISARASESWKIGDISYFNTRLDVSKSLEKSFKLPIRNESELNRFLDFEKENFFGSNHRLFRWNKTITTNIIVDNLIKNKLIDKNDEVVDLNVIERGFSGRVTKLEIMMKNPNKSLVLVRDDIRSILRFLPSNLFTINKLNDNLWLFKGGGFGHGVGLSQSGAIEMAELGFTYEQILNHYYQGTKLKKIEILSE